MITVTTMTTKPDGWIGSDLRSRTEVVEYLKQHGGELVDPSGLAIGQMRRDLGKGRALAQMLLDMEKDGMIEREVRGRRTFRVKLLDDWGLGGEAPRLSPVPDMPTIPASGVDLDLLADVLLQKVVKRASEPAPQSADELKEKRVLADRLTKAEKALDKAQTQLKQVTAAMREATSERDDAKRQVSALQRNLETLQKEMAKPKRGGTPIEQRLSESENKMLRNLMSALPETAESKPRPERVRKTS